MNILCVFANVQNLKIVFVMPRRIVPVAAAPSVRVIGDAQCLLTCLLSAAAAGACSLLSSVWVAVACCLLLPAVTG